MIAPELDIVLPCYNPANGWTKRILEVAQLLKEDLEVRINWVLVNDGSSRKLSKEMLKGLEKGLDSFQYIDYSPNQGKGYALRQGVSASKAPICIFTDIDFPYTQESFLGVYKSLATNEADIVVGVNEESYYQHLPRIRVLISKSLKWMIKTFLQISITDTQRGLKGFNQKGKKVFLATSINRYLADLEFIFLAEREKEISLKAHTVYLNPGVEFSQVSFKILLKEGFNFLKVFMNSWFGK